MKKILVIGIFLAISIISYDNSFIKTIPLKQKIAIRAKESGLDVALVMALVEMESEFNPNNRNKLSTSYGLFGFLKSTSFWTSKAIKLNDIKHFNINEDIQIKLGLYYINYLKKKYNNNTKLMLKEYSGNTKGYVYTVEKKIKKWRKIL